MKRTCFHLAVFVTLALPALWGCGGNSPSGGIQPVSSQPAKTVHVIFTFVDHWEPGEGKEATTKAEAWRDMYGNMARRHWDADGRHPQHDWFCADLGKEPLQVLSEAVFRGLGEMNIHIHHGTPDDSNKDNTEEMRSLLKRYTLELNELGACLTAEVHPRTTFAFIHGNWALDNSRWIKGKPQYCGCDREIDLLLEFHCYADFTFPAWGTMQTNQMRSKIYWTRDSPGPKSYDLPQNIRQVAVGVKPDPHELCIFEGPWADTNVDAREPPTVQRMFEWVNANVHVEGQDRWVFVKVFTHSAQNLDKPLGVSIYMGAIADRFFSDLERVYNDGVNVKLHYCTAREAYNIAMAAEDGHTGDPNDFRDYRIPQPANRHFYCSAFYRLLSYDSRQGAAEIQIEENKLPATLSIWAKDFTPTDHLFERNSPNEDFHPSDASLSSTSIVPLLIKDSTPSKQYLLKRASQ